VGAGVRFLAAGLLLAGWYTARQGRIPRLTLRQFGGTVLIGLLVIGGGIGLLTVGERSVPSGLAALLIASVPAWVVPLRMIHHEKVHPLTVIGVAVGLTGVALLSGLTGHIALTGIAVVLSAAICEAIGSYYTPRFSLPNDPILSTAVQMLTTGPVLFLTGLALGEHANIQEWSGRSLLALIYLIGPGSILAYASFVWLVSRVPASIATTYAYVNPAVALLLGWFILNEKITPGIIVGATLVIAGVATIIIGENRRSKTDRDAELSQRNARRQ
jgi:drug/metabolite transporter (DMT)-like permease